MDDISDTVEFVMVCLDYEIWVDEEQRNDYTKIDWNMKIAYN